jgi:HEAT repeat protein
MHCFCPYCWHEHESGASMCPTCHHSLAERIPYRQALEQALDCPELLTARRAAYLLGVLGESDAAPALIEALESADPYLAAEAVTSLAKLGGAHAWSAVGRARHHRFVVVRRAAIRAFRTAPDFIRERDYLHRACTVSKHGARFS